MKRSLLLGTALAGLGLACALPALAADPAGWYGAIDLGYQKADNVKVSGVVGADVSLNGGAIGFVRGGYRIDPHWRVELEGGYRPDFAKNSGASGHFRSASAMANVLYDIMPDSRLQPFIGGGVGGNFLRVKEDFSPDTSVATKRTDFAWQAIGGVSYALNDHLKVDATYRYFNGGHEDVNCSGDCPPTPLHFGYYRDNSVTLGLRYAFASPPAPPPPPPPPPPAAEAPPPPPPPPPPAPAPPAPPAFVAKEFVVYFPFDQFVLTPEAQTVVQTAASYANDGHATHIVVVGHTDTSGSAAYNLRLSERRAKAVADALVGLNVPQATLNVDWKGKTDLAVATPDGVKEPLNRRSTIDINF